jgi:hypothetical protein
MPVVHPCFESGSEFGSALKNWFSWLRIWFYFKNENPNSEVMPLIEMNKYIF